MKKINIVTIGGGNGQSRLLSELKKYPVNITAIVSMIDNGGSTGRIRKEYHVLPSGDIRRCLVALATDQDAVQNLMSYRFTKGNMKGHNFGNLLILAAEKQLGSYTKMLDFFHSFFKIKGKVLPVTLQSTDLMAILSNNKKVIGETNIDVPKHNARLNIKKVNLTKKVKANFQAIEAIKKADLIIYTIGDLYTSVVPNFLVTGIKEAIVKSKAIKIYTCNRTTKKGETHGFTVKNYTEVLKQYLLPKSLDMVLVDKNLEQPQAGYELVKNNEKIPDLKIIQTDLSIKQDRAHINSKKLAKAIYKICQKLS